MYVDIFVELCGGENGLLVASRAGVSGRLTRVAAMLERARGVRRCGQDPCGCRLYELGEEIKVSALRPCMFRSSVLELSHVAPAPHSSPRMLRARAAHAV